jgi:hypothetical protein
MPETHREASLYHGWSSTKRATVHLRQAAQRQQQQAPETGEPAESSPHPHFSQSYSRSSVLTGSR